MNIALIAHDAKKELMVQFCIAYCGVLSRHFLCATGTTGKMVAEATGLEIQRFLSGSQGGDQQIAARHDKLDRGARSGALSREAQDDLRQQIVELQAYRDLLLQEQPEDAPAAFGLIQVRFGRQVAAFEAGAAKTGERLSNLFRFVEAVFGEGQEMLILVTELTAGYYSARFISRHGCAEYFAHNRELLFYERQKELISQLNDLDIES